VSSHKSIDVLHERYGVPDEGSRLYDESKGCTKEVTTLRPMLKLLMLKARYCLSDAGYVAFFSIIADMLPIENKVLANTCYANKIISLLTIGLEKIHTCRKHCIIYRGDGYKDLDSCRKCGASRYKTNKPIVRKSVLHLFLKGKVKESPKEDPTMFKTAQRKRRCR
jgi:hypothetical protein